MSDDIVMLSLDDFAKLKNKKPVKHRKSYYNQIDEYTIDGVYVRTWQNSNVIGEFYGISSCHIRECVNGKILSIEKIGKIFLKENSDIKQRLKEIEASKLHPTGKAARIVVKEYNLKGNLVMVYPSISIAADYHKKHCYTLYSIINGKRLCTDDGKIFLREGQSIEERLEMIKQRNYNECMGKSIDMYSLKGTPNGHFRNASDVAERFNISALSVIDSCLGVTKQCKGNIFLFSGDSIKERLKQIKQKKK